MTTVRRPIPEKSSGLRVKTGRSLATAVAAMSASYARAVLLRPEARSSEATRPKARAGVDHPPDSPRYFALDLVKRWFVRRGAKDDDVECAKIGDGD
jgi:hypothetical protein